MHYGPCSLEGLDEIVVSAVEFQGGLAKLTFFDRYDFGSNIAFIKMNGGNNLVSKSEDQIRLNIHLLWL